MSSLRLALKQSLQETGHLAPTKEKRKKSSASSSSHNQQHHANANGANAAGLVRKKKHRQPGEPPRRRGRPPKHQNRHLGGDNYSSHHQLSRSRVHSDDEDESSEHHFSSENEFSHESENESHDEGEHDEDEYEEDESQHPDEEEETEALHTLPQSDKIEAEVDDEDEDEDETSAEGEVERDTVPEHQEHRLDIHKKPKKLKKILPLTPKQTESSSDDDYRRQKKLKKQLKHSAANKIQSQWKKKKEQSHEETNSIDEKPMIEEQQQQQQTNSSPESNIPRDIEKPLQTSVLKEYENKSNSLGTRKKKRRDKPDQTTSNSKGSGKSNTVPPPAADILEWSRSLSEKRSRKHIKTGLRVKVRFATKVKREKKVIKKKKWYGGRVTAVSKEGSRIKIQYDDGTSEITKFPDKDIVVDEESNGQHLVPADKFLPPALKAELVEADDTRTGEAMERDTPSLVQESKRPSEEKLERKSQKTSSLPKSLLSDERKVERQEDPTEASSSLDRKPQKQVEKPKAQASTPPPDQQIKFSKPTEEMPPPSNELLTPAPAKVELSVEAEPSTSSLAPKKKAKASNISAKAVASPEEGELSPGLTFSRGPGNVSSSVKPIELTSLDQLLSKEKKPVAKEVGEASAPEREQTEENASCSDANEEEANRVPLVVKSKAPQHETVTKPSFTIRIPNVKTEEKSLLKGKHGVSDESDETSDEEIGALSMSRNIDARKSVGTERVEEPPLRPSLPSRKRAASDTSTVSEGPPPPKKRIHLKRPDREVLNEVRGSEHSEGTSDLSLGGLKPFNASNNGSRSMQREDKIPVTTDRAAVLPERKDERSKPEPKFIPEIGQKSSAVDAVMNDEVKRSSLPLGKQKRKREASDRATSPRSPRPTRNPRRSPIPAVMSQAESPEPMSAEPKAAAVISRPMTKSLPDAPVLTGVNDLENVASGDSVTSQKRSVILTGSKNSAFERKQPGGHAKDANDSLGATSGNDKASEEDITPHVEGKSATPKLRDRSKSSVDAVSSNARSGRRAAQQAKERMNSKQDLPPVESAKKKKKKRKKEGKDSDDEESETSEDDRQWVQCDSCGKWRILPSTVKASSLPKHWYCHLNIHDPKRNNCAAPEQTPKQVAKERKRAKKRARQRMEQGELMPIPEEPRKETSRTSESGKEVSSMRPNSPKPKESTILRDQPVTTEQQPNNGKQRRSSPALVASNEQTTPPDSGSETRKNEKKVAVAKKGKLTQEANDMASSAPPEPVVEPKEKHGRRRGRPARDSNKESERGNSTRTASQEKKEEGDNVEWVQCEKCDKWRKLPPHISADELPDVWYCSLNTWNPKSASCDSPEDKADALHQDVGIVGGTTPTGNPGKFSYRSLIFGTGRKHNRPMSERTRAAESLFATPVEDGENPYPTVMYAKSSAFLPRTSNFTKSNAVEQKTISVFDVMSNSALFAELRGGSDQYFNSYSVGQSRKAYTFARFPDVLKKPMKELVLQSLGTGTLTGDDVVSQAQSVQWENVPQSWLQLRNHCTTDIVVNTLLDLVKEGVIEMTVNRNSDRPLYEWIPKYRLVRARRNNATEEAMKASKCMKISKPWKQKEESNSHWISGRTAIA